MLGAQNQEFYHHKELKLYFLVELDFSWRGEKFKKREEVEFVDEEGRRAFLLILGPPIFHVCIFFKKII